MNKLLSFTKDTNAKDSKKKMVQDKLLELVHNGQYQQGDKLPSERELSQILEVSRNVLREAVVSLVAGGVIEVRERQGIFIKNIKDGGAMDALQSLQILPADFVSYQLEVRMIIAVPAARLAAQRRTDEDIRKLRECYANFMNSPYGTMEEQAANGKWEALLHHLVTEAAHNPILCRINESVNTLVEKNNLLIHPNLLHEAGWIEHIQQQHKIIITAIESRDSKTAGDTLEKHMIESVQMMREKHPHLITDIPFPSWNF